MDTELKAIDIDAIINTMADELAQMMERKQIVEPLMIGVNTGG